jgi:sporulation protein YlmC with PRC-barrel domain
VNKGLTVIFTIGMPALATDGACGEVADLVVDPITWKVTHLVIEPPQRHDRSRLVPIAGVTWTDQTVALSLSMAQVAACPPVEETDFIPLESWPHENVSWDDGITRVLSWPYYPYGALRNAGYIGYPYGYGTGREWGGLPMVTTSYDRLPNHTVEIRRNSDVVSSDDHTVGQVDGFAVDTSGKITHLILEHGHLWDHRDITIPLDDIKSVTSDRVELKVRKDEVGSYPSVPFSRHTLAV